MKQDLDLCHSSASPATSWWGDLNTLLSFLSASVSLPVKWGYLLPRKDVVRIKQCMKALRAR